MALRICRILKLRGMKTCKVNGTTSVLKITNAKTSFKKCNVNLYKIVWIKYFSQSLPSKMGSDSEYKLAQQFIVLSRRYFFNVSEI